MILGLCLGLVAVLVHGRTERPVTAKALGLGDAFARVGAWTTGEDIGFDPLIIDALLLDDYTHRTYLREQETVWVYIGYYLRGGTIGASHSPLVCYPGQGWVIRGKQRIDRETDGLSVRMMSMVAEKDGQQDLVLYWFQAHDQTAPDTFRQKLQAMWARTISDRSDSAFVRISVPVGAGGVAVARRTALAFVDDFYPMFHAYVIDDTNPPAAETRSGDFQRQDR